jgi:hypothetical protein
VFHKHVLIARRRLRRQVSGWLHPSKVTHLGLRVDVNALPAQVIGALRGNAINLNDPAITVTLIKLNRLSLTRFSSSRPPPLVM